MLDTTQAKADPFEASRAFLARHGYPEGDNWERPTSEARFPDGAHFRIEVPTVNSADAVKTLVRIVEEEAGVKINRIDQTAGIMRFSDAEHEAYLDVDERTTSRSSSRLGPRGIYDIGAQKLVNSGVGPCVGAAHPRHGADCLRDGGHQAHLCHGRARPADFRRGNAHSRPQDAAGRRHSRGREADGVGPHGTQQPGDLPDARGSRGGHHRLAARPRLLHPRGVARRGAHPAPRPHRQPAGDRRLPALLRRTGDDPHLRAGAAQDRLVGAGAPRAW